MLLLTLNLLHRLQQLRTAGGGSSSTSSSSAAAAAPAQAEGALTRQLVGLGEDWEDAALTADTMALWQQHAVAICTAFEGFVRAASSGALPDVQPILSGIADLCCEGDVRPGLLHALAQAGSSEQQVACFNLLLSLLKLARIGAPDECSSDADTTTLILAVLPATALSMLEVAAAAVDGSSGGLVSLWLLLLGCCFLQCAAALQQIDGQGGGLVESIEQMLREAASGGGVVTTSVYDRDVLTSYLMLCRDTHSLLRLLENCSSSSSSLCAGLSAAGYDVGPIAQGLEALAACCVFIDSNELIVDQDMPSAVAEMVRGPPGLIQALTSAGHALSVFAVPHCCNNPSCSNTVGLTEASIVSGQGCICAGCKVARYCGKPCQAVHWKAAHKPVCRMLRARSAGTA